MKMTVTFLGTGTSFGVPVIGCRCAVCTSDKPENKRLRASVLLQSGDFNLTIDCSPDFRQQAHAHQINHLEAILFTHNHADHVNGIDDLRAYWWHQRRPVRLYGEPYVIRDIQERFNYCFREQLFEGAAPVLDLISIDSETPLQIGPFNVLPVRARHWNLDILGFRIGRFAYMTDCSEIPPASIDKLRGVEHLVLNALRWKPHAAHFSLDQAVAVGRQIGAPHVYFTHISHKLEHFEAQAHLENGFQMSYDGLRIEV
ncbi:MAG: MBL fold metallo-hydrolase [Candidatus Sumerlaeia bacterium]